MSIKVMSAVWESDLPAMERLIMLCLADHANDEGECYPSILRLCKRTGLSERAVQNNLKKLVEAGHLEVVGGGGRGRANLYRITANPAPKTPFVEKPRTKNPVSDDINPAPDDINPARDAPEPLRTIKEPSEEIRAELCKVLSERAADDFIAHRKAKRSKLTLRAAELIVQKLATTANPDAVIENTISNGWTGVFPKGEKTNDEPSKSQSHFDAFLAGARGAS